ncbi:MAG: flagellar brake protein [Bacillota bacterium]
MLQYLSLLQPNQKIFVCNEEDATRYISFIKTFNSDMVYITVPENNALPGSGQKKLLLHKDVIVKIQLPVSGHLYQLIGKVAGTCNADDEGYVMVSVPQNIERIEMRRCMRVNKVLRVQYAVLSSLEDEPDYKAAEALNISAGGMKLAVAELIEQGKQLVLQFVLPLDNKYSRFKEISVVTRAVPLSYPDEDMFYIGIEFTNIKKNKFELMSRYVMKTLWTEAL